MMYSHNPAGEWTDKHQMTVNGKHDGFSRDDLLQVAASSDLKGTEQVIEEVLAAVSRWPDFALQAGVEDKQIRAIGKQHRMFS
jgi:serine/threonine-protein kinase HipA